MIFLIWNRKKLFLEQRLILWKINKDNNKDKFKKDRLEKKKIKEKKVRQESLKIKIRKLFKK